MVRDTSLKTDRLLTLVPLNRYCPLTVCPSTKDILNNLFLALQHPYICPVFHVDFLKYEDQTYIVLMQPINQGSLKDLIYSVSKMYSAFQKKYAYELHLFALLNRSQIDFYLPFRFSESFIGYYHFHLLNYQCQTSLNKLNFA